MKDRAISLNEAIARIKTKAKRIKNSDTLNGLAGAITILYELPPVTPNEEEMSIKYMKGYNTGFCHAQAIFQKEPKTGNWIRFKNFENGYYHIKCSECGQYWSIDGHAKIFRYCFNCGTKMQAESNIKQGLNYADEDTLMSAT